MDYQKHYNALISRAKLQNRKKLNRNNPNYQYYEKHHIIPDCFYIDNRSKGKSPGHLKGNANSSNNLVLLTAREHFIAHQLLVKIYPDKSTLVFALNMMALDRYGKRTSNRRYEWIRKKFSNALSQDRSGKNSHFYGKSSHNSGKTLEELYGIEKATEMKSAHSSAMKGRTSPNKGKKLGPSWNAGKTFKDTEKLEYYSKQRNQRVSKSLTGRTRSAEERASLSAAAKIREEKKRIAKLAN